MKLNEILEENSVKAISAKTNISEENIELLLAEDFTHLSKTKALGFISILEREYGADLSKVKEQALAYYDANQEDHSVNLVRPVIEEKKRSSTWVVVLVLALFAYASWYFFTQFDKKNLHAMLPFSEGKADMSVVPEEVILPKEEKVEESLSIKNALLATQTDGAGVQTDIVEMNIEPIDTNVTAVEPTVRDTQADRPAPVETKSITLIPENRLWFGIIDIATGKRDHFSISEKYEIDVKEKSWLVATSSAPFSFVHEDETQAFNDGKAHYFKIDKRGVALLNKAEYVEQGGWKKW